MSSLDFINCPHVEQDRQKGEYCVDLPDGKYLKLCRLCWAQVVWSVLETLRNITIKVK